jgi:hypothetical protein
MILVIHPYLCHLFVLAQIECIFIRKAYISLFAI